ncbi:MAG: MEMO1 family protein [Methanobacteriota archaeon]|nr:MAG: MEMO1 family protein [Euryarchaeota archaeon]
MRSPAVAGQFYAGSRKDLVAQIEECFKSPLGPQAIPKVQDGPRGIIGAMSPHAGYMFSGPVAAHLFSSIAADGFPETFVMIGPNHTGAGSGIALTLEDFETPMGVAKVDAELAEALRKDLIDVDPQAHFYEHSIEVQLPFLQYLSSDFKFVPITMALQDFDAAFSVGETVREAIRGRDAVVIASSDMSHYVTPETAKTKDHMALDAIERMDAKALYEVVLDENISMCGYGPVMAMITACKGGGVRMLKYATSGDVRPMNDVVGYASLVVEKKS